MLARLPGATLLTVLTDYAGTGDTPYLSGVRATLDPAVGVLWTGPAVQHTNFSPQDAQAYGGLIGRAPIVWDNWSNTDGCCTLPASQDHTTALLGPYRRRADIVGSVGGVFLQPTNEADLNKLPLATAADWLDDPGGYDPDVAWRTEVARLTGGNSAAGDLLRAWAETYHFTKSDLYTSAIGSDRAAGQAPTLRALSGAFLAAYPGAGWADASASLSQELDKAGRARTALTGAADGGFLAQVSPFLQGSHMAARAGHLGTALLGAQRPVATVRTDGGLSVTPQAPDVGAAGAILGLYGGAAATQRALIPCSYGFHAARSADGRFACGPGARWYFDAITPNNVLDGYLDEVDRLSASWRGAAASTNPSQAPLTLSVAGLGDYTVTPGATRTLPAAACGRALTIRDAAGGSNSFTLPPCGNDPRTPTTVLDGGPSGPENSRGAVFSFHASVPGSRFTCRLDGAASACRSPSVYTDLPDGDHSFTVTATDPAGRDASASETRFWRVDRRRPTPPSGRARQVRRAARRRASGSCPTRPAASAARSTADRSAAAPRRSCSPGYARGRTRSPWRRSTRPATSTPHRRCGRGPSTRGRRTRSSSAARAASC
jgi:beta-N-acetylglucosaminidase